MQPGDRSLVAMGSRVQAARQLQVWLSSMHVLSYQAVLNRMGLDQRHNTTSQHLPFGRLSAAGLQCMLCLLEPFST